MHEAEKVGENPNSSPLVRKFFWSRLGLRGRLMAALIPSVIITLLAAGLANYSVSSHYIHTALERSIRLRNVAVANEVEHYLNQVREDLLFAAQESLNKDVMRDFIEDKAAAGGNMYLEFVYLAPSGQNHIALFRKDGETTVLNERQFARIQPNPLLLLSDHADLQPGQVWISKIAEVEYPMPAQGVGNAMVREQVVRFVTPYRMRDADHDGLLMISVRAADLRNVLSLYNSEDSPLKAFPRSAELRFDFVTDTDGWMLFESSNRQKSEVELATSIARSGYQGTLGRPGLRCAFRPNAKHTRYWVMLDKVRKGENGLVRVQDSETSSTVNDYFFAFAPIVFHEGGTRGDIVYGACVRVDRSILPVVAGYRYLDVMLVVTVVVIALIAMLIWWLGRKLTSPIRQLSEKLNSLHEVEALEEVSIPYGGRDIEELKNSVNALVRRISRQMVEIHEKDEAILNVNLREPVDLCEEQALLDEVRLSVLPDIIGVGARMTELKNDVLKAAQVEVDVLVTGETGTGKQLVAEAIHSQSSRKDGPFISINCGALDENLLLDALFGHVKGAFTEARNDRNGAFQEAESGTLFLDEVQSASPKVQQSLLRALSIRKIKPLGSDTEVPVDVRIIAAANVDLSEMIEDGLFREDLYYRLKVVSIHTPALREHPENIPLLALHYLHQAEQLTGQGSLELSKGALRKLSGYSWPGNIRELVNSITRAGVMAETDVIQAEEIRLEGESASGMGAEFQKNEADNDGVKEDIPVSAPRQNNLGLNPRQEKAWAVIRKRGGISRSEYQELVGGNLSPRTANYDLNEFVGKDMLQKVGKGPATRYVVPESRG